MRRARMRFPRELRTEAPFPTLRVFTVSGSC